ncbi:PH and SEC7 domain-containing protein 1-like [Sinocyclocheilus grahami]|uniref:PH and SEC7 domain-containing protein 1-like n=1 Tax=Sinocyclocheilus grahami TaxID=75366 RepID=UPI0007ACE5AB|nr:PREDICTED: PH and SEC7 domain-containing protein 1-like [Sinocyclocheilus grahami]
MAFIQMKPFDTRPESSQNSNQSDHPSSGIQSDGGSLVPGPSLHCQKIARAKWEFLFGTPAENTASKQEKNVPESSTAPPSGHSTPIPPSYLPLEELALRANHDVQHVEVELVTPPPAAPGTSPKTGIIRRTLKYSETDLDAVPLRCYRETDIDEVLLAEQEDADSAFGSNRSVMGTSCAGSSPLGEMSNERTDGQEEEEEEEEEDVASWVTVRMQGDVRRLLADQERDEEEEFYSMMLKRPQDRFSNNHPALKSPILVRGPCRRSGDSLDTFSRHFENIMESHRAKGTSYSSLDSLDPLTSSTQTVLTFDFPTLTPQVQGQIYQSARQIVELSFAPLAHIEMPSLSESALTITGETDATRAPSSERLSSGSDDRNGQSWQSNPPLSLPSSTGLICPQTPEEMSESVVSGQTAQVDCKKLSINTNMAEVQRVASERRFGRDGLRKKAHSVFCWHCSALKERSVLTRCHTPYSNDFSRLVAEEYLRYFNFTEMTLDQALRAISEHMTPVISQTHCRHGNRFMVLMRTNVGKRMSCTQFIGNLEGLNSSHDFPKELLKEVEVLHLVDENTDSRWDRKHLKSDRRSEGEPMEIDGRRLTVALLNTFHIAFMFKCTTVSDMIGVNSLHSAGRLRSRSLCSVRYGRDFRMMDPFRYPRTPRSRSLKPLVFPDLLGKAQDGQNHPQARKRKRLLVRGGELKVFGSRDFQVGVDESLQRLVERLSPEKHHADGTADDSMGEYRPDKQLSDEDLKNAVSIHHSLAIRATDYSKRPNVFYLRTADWRVYLFQAPNAEQMQSWITRINTVAAMFSAPPLPAAIGSQKKFSRPLLPGSASKLSQEEQVQAHEARFRSISTELVQLRSYPPDRKVKGRELEEYRMKEEYLEFEKTRYETYSMLLRAKQRCDDDDLSVFEAMLLEEGALQRAQSSPTLQESSMTCSTRDGASQSAAAGAQEPSGNGNNGCSRGQGQRHSYRQAVRK